MTIRELMEEQRTLVGSSDLAEQLAAALLIPGLLRERLRELDDFHEGRRLGRAPLSVDRNALVRDRLAGMSLTDVAKKYRISRASVVRVVRDAKRQMLAAA